MLDIGNKYSNWTIIKPYRLTNKGQTYWCQCNCGKEKEIRGYDLLNTKSEFCMGCRHASKEIKIGEKFGEWTVTKQISYEVGQKEPRRKRYEVQCKCGAVKILQGIRLRFGDSNACRKCGSTKHGRAHSKTYSTWESMIQRCTNVNHKNYKHYGGRGITVCERWNEFIYFLEDMGERPPLLELDRIDNNANYEKNNCRWVTRKENMNNTRISKKNKK